MIIIPTTINNSTRGNDPNLSAITLQKCGITIIIIMMMWFTAPSRAQPVSQSDSEPAEDNSKWSANTLFRFHEHFVSLVPVPTTTGPAVPIIGWEIALDPGNNSSKRINQSTTADTASQPASHQNQHSIHWLLVPYMDCSWPLCHSQPSEVVVGGDRQTDGQRDRSNPWEENRTEGWSFLHFCTTLSQIDFSHDLQLPSQRGRRRLSCWVHRWMMVVIRQWYYIMYGVN